MCTWWLKSQGTENSDRFTVNDLTGGVLDGLKVMELGSQTDSLNLTGSILGVLKTKKRGLISQLFILYIFSRHTYLLPSLRLTLITYPPFYLPPHKPSSNNFPSFIKPRNNEHWMLPATVPRNPVECSASPRTRLLSALICVSASDSTHYKIAQMAPGLWLFGFGLQHPQLVWTNHSSPHYVCRLSYFPHLVCSQPLFGPGDALTLTPHLDSEAASIKRFHFCRMFIFCPSYGSARGGRGGNHAGYIVVVTSVSILPSIWRWYGKQHKHGF